MNAQESLALMLDPSLIFKAQGLTCDPWQRALLLSTSQHILLNCSRQSGKSTVVAALALHTALFQPRCLVLILSRAQRQAHELFRKVLEVYNALGRPVPPVQDTQSVSKLELENGSRIIGLPGKEETVRGFSGVNLLLIDEAAKVPDDLYNAVRPMLAVSQGRLVLLSTPFGQRGFFWREWHRKGGKRPG
jgi:phage terminase large subunit-like protein